MNSSDAAETLVKITLEGTEFALKITGTAASYLVPLIIAKLQEQNESVGKTKLIKLLKSEKPLKIFSIKLDDVKEFRSQAKRYGINYAELKHKKNDKDDIVDLIVKAEDAARVNRMVERFNLSNFNENEIRSKIQDSDDKESNNEVISPIKDPDSLVADIFSKQEKEAEAPLLDKEIGKKSPLECYYTSKNNQSSITSNDRPSVIENLQKIKEEQVNKDIPEEETIKSKTKEIKHQQPKIKKKKERGNKDGYR